jgi:hypothetical protein
MFYDQMLCVQCRLALHISNHSLVLIRSVFSIFLLASCALFAFAQTLLPTLQLVATEHRASNDCLVLIFSVGFCPFLLLLSD